MIALSTVRSYMIAIAWYALSRTTRLVMVLSTVALSHYFITIRIITCFNIALARSAYWITPPTSWTRLRLLVLTVFTRKIGGVAFALVAFLFRFFLDASATVFAGINGAYGDTGRSYVTLIALAMGSTPFGNALRG